MLRLASSVFAILALVALCCGESWAQPTGRIADDQLPPLDFPMVDDGTGPGGVGADPGDSGSRPGGGFRPSDVPPDVPTDLDPFTDDKNGGADDGTGRDSGLLPLDGDDERDDETSVVPEAEPVDQRIREFLAPVYSSGDWYNCCSWYGNIDFMLTWRSIGRPAALGADFSTPASRVITTDNVGFRVEPGFRILAGRFLGRDIKNRDASVEFEYMGLQDWETGQLLQSVFANGIFTAIDHTGGFIGGFNAADQQRYRLRGDYNSFEMNVRLSHRPGRDRMIALPDGTWSRQIARDGVANFFAGLRYVSVSERLQWESRRIGVASTVFGGDYDIRTYNQLFGVQFGGGYEYVTKIWSVGGRAKAGGYLNFADIHRRIRSADPNPGQVLINFDGDQKDEVLGVVLELNIYATYNVNPNFRLRGGWHAIWINGLATAPDQLTFEPSRARIQLGGNTFFQGVNLGCEWAW